MRTTNTASPKEANKVSGNNSGKNKEGKYVAMGVGFVKTRMAAWKVQKIIDSMEDIAESLDVELIDVIVDRSGSRDIDRKAIDDIYEWLDNAPVQFLIVGSLKDISDDKDDFDRFMEDMSDRKVVVMCLEGNTVIMPSIDDDDDDDDCDDE